MLSIFGKEEKGNEKQDYLPIGMLKNADYNPRTLSKKQAEKLEESIRKFGFVEPVVVNTHPDRNCVIVGGHQRVQVAKRMGITEVPVVLVNLTLQEEKELNVRLNKNVGEFDFDKLANEFEVVDLLDWGFEEAEFGIRSEFDDEPEDDNIQGSSGKKEIECPNCGEKFYDK